MSDLLSFIRESNRIEGIHRRPTRAEIAAHETFLGLDTVRVEDVGRFVREVAQRAIRSRPGMNVSVGGHKPPPGGPGIVDRLTGILLAVNCCEVSPYEAHQEYEHLHPFMDGNGRSGRVLWAWHRKRTGHDPFVLGFLHSFYYEALSAGHRCEALRVEHVTEQMGALAGSFRRPNGSTTQWFGDGKAHGALEHHRSDRRAAPGEHTPTADCRCADCVAYDESSPL